MRANTMRMDQLFGPKANKRLYMQMQNAFAKANTGLLTATCNQLLVAAGEKRHGFHPSSIVHHLCINDTLESTLSS